MSFAGHIFDMIRRNKEDRETLRRLRNHLFDGKTRYTSSMPNVTAKEFEETLQQAKEQQQQEQRSFIRMKGVAFGVFTLLSVLLLLFLKLCI